MLDPILRQARFLDLIITRSDLLARRFQSAFEHYKQDDDTAPLTLSLAEWVNRCWSLEQYNKQASSLLNTIQAVSIWSEIVATDPSLTNLKAGALAYEAWNFCKIHQIDYLDPRFQENAASHKWQAFAKQFHAWCNEHKQVDLYTLVERLTQSTLPQRVLPKRIGLFGFHASTLLEQQLLTYFKEQGCFVQFLKPLPLPASTTINTITLDDSYHELDTMAHWAFQALHQQSNQTVVCLIPQLSRQRSQVIAIFKRAASECLSLDNHNDYPLSLPLETISLQTLSLIQTALTIINITMPVSLTSLSPLLRSPYLSDAQGERYQRSQLDRCLRQQNSPLITDTAFKQYSAQYGCPALSKCFTIWQSQLTTSNRLPSQWVEYWQVQLKAWGWPNVTILSDEERYYYAKWSSILEEFSTLDRLLADIDIQKALNTLNDFVNDTSVPLQPTCSLKTVQLVDTKDMQDYLGDKMWLSNGYQAPTKSNLTNPFIPYKLQQSAQSQTTIISTLEEVASRVNTLIVSSTQSIYLPFNINVHTLSVTGLLRSYLPIAEKMSTMVKWESLEDQWGSPLVNYEVIGGSDLIKKQAICPFRAFADYRLVLKSEALIMASIAPTVAEKAIYLHRVLERVWEQLKTQHQLNRLSEVALDQLLQAIIDQAMQKHQKQRPYLWRAAFAKLEKEKVHKLVKKWLDVEKKRPSFSIKSVEYPITGTIGPLKLQFAIDRIDELSNGSLLLIDYKSGSQLPTRQGWMGSRPTDPQLPLYLLSMEEMAHGIAWVHMHPEYGGKFLGISVEDMAISGIQADDAQKPLRSWEALRAEWQIYLEELASQFSKGYAAVNPKDGDISCRYCQYALLCRVKQPHS